MTLLPPEVQGYTIEKPARISLDLLGTDSAVDKYNELNAENAKSVTVIEAGDRTRLIVNLDRPEGYSTRVDGNNLFVTIGGARSRLARPAPTPVCPT